MANQNGTVTVKNAVWTVQKYCRKKSTNWWLGKRNKNKKKSDEQYILNKPKVL